MIDAEFAAAFARDWTRAWNDHDLEAILTHYSDDVEFHSPRIRQVTGEDRDSVSGKAALRRYWSLALQGARDLYFEIDRVFVGADSLTIAYTNHRQQAVAETFIFGPGRKVTTGIAAYA